MTERRGTNDGGYRGNYWHSAGRTSGPDGLHGIGSAFVAPLPHCQPQRFKLPRHVRAGIAIGQMQAQARAFGERQLLVLPLREQAGGLLAGDSEHLVSDQATHFQNRVFRGKSATSCAPGRVVPRRSTSSGPDPYIIPSYRCRTPRAARTPGRRRRFVDDSARQPESHPPGTIGGSRTWLGICGSGPTREQIVEFCSPEAVTRGLFRRAAQQIDATVLRIEVARAAMNLRHGISLMLVGLRQHVKTQLGQMLSRNSRRATFTGTRAARPLRLRTMSHSRHCWCSAAWLIS